MALARVAGPDRCEINRGLCRTPEMRLRQSQPIKHCRNVAGAAHLGGQTRAHVAQQSEILVSYRESKSS